MSRVSIRNAGLLGFVGLLAALAMIAWSMSGVMGTASAQDGVDAAVNGSDWFPLADQAAGSESWFIKIGDIDGESKDVGHENWIDLLSVSQSIARPSGSQAAGKASFEPIVFLKRIDKSTPKLMEAIATGQVFPEVEIHLTAPTGDGGRAPYLKWELKNVSITSYSVEGNNNNRPMEEVALNFAEIKVSYTESKDDGSSGDEVEFTWKVEAGRR